MGCACGFGRHWGVVVSSTSVEPFQGSSGSDNTYEGIPESNLARDKRDGTFTDPVTFNETTDVFLILTASPRADRDVRVKVNYDKNSDTFFILVQKKEYLNWVEAGQYTVSLIEGTKDGFGKSIYYEDVLEDNDYIKLIVNPAVVGDYDNQKTSFTVASDYTLVDKGAKEDATDTDIGNAWDEYTSKSMQARIYMDPTGSSGIPAKFNSLRNDYHNYSLFLSPLPLGTTFSDVTSMRAIGGHLATINNPGLAFSWVWHKERNSFGGKDYWTSLVGSWGSKIADMESKYYGLAPAGTDEDSFGGQISDRNIIEVEHEPSDTELAGADAAGVNPIVYDPNFGIMIMSQKTAQRPSSQTDTSYLGHSNLYDTIRKYIREQVLVYQLLKLNDGVHQRQVRNKINTYLRPILGLGLLADDGTIVICDNTNNTDEVKASAKFVIDIVLKVNPFSEGIVVNYIYLGQTNTIEEVVS